MYLPSYLATFWFAMSERARDPVEYVKKNMGKCCHVYITGVESPKFPRL